MPGSRCTRYPRSLERRLTGVVERDDLVQVAERALLEAERAYSADPSDANQRRVTRAWSEVREARGESTDDDPGPPFPQVAPRR